MLKAVNRSDQRSDATDEISAPSLPPPQLTEVFKLEASTVVERSAKTGRKGTSNITRPVTPLADVTAPQSKGGSYTRRETKLIEASTRIATLVTGGLMLLSLPPPITYNE